MNNYEILGVDYNADQRAIKRAYSILIKQYRPDSHPLEFARIRSAYEKLLEQCRYREQYEVSDTIEWTEVESPTITQTAEQFVQPVDNSDSQQQPEDRQTENNDDSFNRLVDKPFIQLDDLQNSDGFNHPVIPQQVTELDPDLAWIEKPAINVTALIEQLHAYKQPANEQAALTCFQSQLLSFATMNLDQRMDYEEKLYASLLHNDRPALLVFAAASDYFDWTNSNSWVKASQSQWSKQRFEAFSQLSALYRRICTRYNPYFQAPHDAAIKPHRVSTHYHHLLAQQQRKEWFCLCQAANLTDLHAYFAERPQSRPVYAIDILLGAGLSYCVLQDTLLDQAFNYPVLLEHYQLSLLAISALAITGGLLSALLLSGLRAVWLFLQALMSNVRSDTKSAVFFAVITLIVTVIIYRMMGTDDVGLLIFSILTISVFYIVLLIVGCPFLVYLYSWLIQLETMTARIVESIARLPFLHKKPIVQQTINSKIWIPATMNKQIYPLLIAQFLSAFADNAILFTVIAMVMQSSGQASWYIPALQSMFLIAYVILGPWVGGFADHHAKSRVLIIANLIKAAGAALLLVGVEPLIAYCIVGVGAAIYSPAKYGILPELAGHDVLLRANSWIEGSTILAILLGMKIGAMIADYSTQTALLMTIVLFIVSALATLSLPVKVTKKTSTDNALLEFGKQMRLFFTTPRSRFSVLGGSLFWAAAASLRVILIAWAPLVLMSKNASEIADLTLYLTVGIIAGSIIVPYLIPMEHLRRARIPAYLMAVLIAGLSFTTSVLPAQAVLFAIGMMGGLFVVPINAVLQEQGQQTIGSGSAVALQNFFQNLAMLLAVGAYTLAASQQVNPVVAMFALGVLVLVATFWVSLHLPDNQAE